MRSLTDFLKRFRDIRPPHEVLQRSLGSAIASVTTIQIPPNKITLSGGVAFILLSSVEKNEIMLHKAAILRALREEHAVTAIRDIR